MANSRLLLTFGVGGIAAEIPNGLRPSVGDGASQHVGGDPLGYLQVWAVPGIGVGDEVGIGKSFAQFVDDRHARHGILHPPEKRRPTDVGLQSGFESSGGGGAFGNVGQQSALQRAGGIPGAGGSEVLCRDLRPQWVFTADTAPQVRVKVRVLAAATLNSGPSTGAIANFWIRRGGTDAGKPLHC